MNRRLLLWILVTLVTAAGCASRQVAWEHSVSSSGGERFIPIELWSGSRWDGYQSIQQTNADFTFGERSHKTIRGPMQWKHPKTGETLSVYERINRTTKGIKRQLFTVNPDGTGLAKVYDERPGAPIRYFTTNAVLFPLGTWKKGEKRYFDFEEFVDGQWQKRRAMVYIRRLNFTYKKVQNSLKYDWISEDETGRMVFHERFIYGPREGLMYFKNRMDTDT